MFTRPISRSFPPFTLKTPRARLVRTRYQLLRPILIGVPPTRRWTRSADAPTLRPLKAKLRLVVSSSNALFRS